MKRTKERTKAIIKKKMKKFNDKIDIVTSVISSDLMELSKAKPYVTNYEIGVTEDNSDDIGMVINSINTEMAKITNTNQYQKPADQDKQTQEFSYMRFFIYMCGLHKVRIKSYA